MNRKCICILYISLIFIMIAVSGCSHISSLAVPVDVDWVTAVEPEYVSEWPDNRFTRYIPKPGSGTIEYIRDYSDYGRYEIVVNDISQSDFDSYIEILKKTGYSNIAQKSNKVSVGLMLENDEVYLSIAYSEPGFNAFCGPQRPLVRCPAVVRRRQRPDAKHYSTVLLTRASIAHDFMAKRQDSAFGRVCHGKKPIMRYSCQEPFAA